MNSTTTSSSSSTTTSSSSSLSSSSSQFQESIFEYSFDNPKKMDTLMGSKGIFSFSLFRNFQDDRFNKLVSLFKQGISKYIELTKREHFKDYIVLVYIDNSLFDFSDYEDPVLLKKKAINSIKYIYNPDDRQIRFGNFDKEPQDPMQKIARAQEIQKWTENAIKELNKIIEEVKKFIEYLQSEPNCILCKYTIPMFLIPGSTRHYNYIGSMARFHALLRFADRRVCVRDADTYFPDLWFYHDSTPEPKQSIAKNFVQYLEEWEVNLLKYHSTKNLPFLIAYDHSYVFHNFRKNPVVRNTRLLAATVEAFPHDKSLFTDEDWNNAMLFLKEDSTIYNIRGKWNLKQTEKINIPYKNQIENKYKYNHEFSQNNFKAKQEKIGKTYYGCDEKILRYIFYEKWRDYTVLFYFPYAYLGSHLIYSDVSQEGYKDSPLSKYEKLLDDNTSEADKKDPLYLYIKELIELYKKMNYIQMNIYGQSQIKVPPGQFYFLLIPIFPFISEQLAHAIYGKTLNSTTIKGGYKKSLKSRKSKKSQKLRKSRKH